MLGPDAPAGLDNLRHHGLDRPLIASSFGKPHAPGRQVLDLLRRLVLQATPGGWSRQAADDPCLLVATTIGVPAGVAPRFAATAVDQFDRCCRCSVSVPGSGWD
jgi:hypothetical protein